MDEDATAATQGGLVGRDRPLATVATLLADARRGRGRSALVLGEPGIGKTALMRALADQAGSDGLTTVWCWCTPGRPVPFATWRPLLRRLGLTDATPTADQSLAAVHDRERMFASILDGLESLTQAGPVLLVVEDAHWADEPSLTLLRVVVAAVPGLPVCLVVTARDEPEDLPDVTARALAGLPSEVVRLTLEPLGGADVARLLAQVTGWTADDPLAARVRERTGGNPFLVVEVGRGLTESSPESLPHGARELVSRRLRRLSTGARDALVCAAVVGDPIDVSLVAEVIERPESEVIDLLDAAGRARLLAPAPDGALRFVHALVSEVLLADAAAGERARLHEGTASVLERRGGTGPGRLAHHWSLSIGPRSRERAAHWSVEEARDAGRRLGFEQAVTAYRRALAMTREDRLALALELAEAQWLAGDTSASRATYREVTDQARAAGRPDHLARAALGLGGGMAGFEVALRDEVQVELLREARGALPAGDSLLHAAIGARLSVALTELAPDAERIALAEEAVAEADRVGDPTVRVAALAAYCDAIAGPAHVNARRAAAERMRAIADETGDHVGRLLARRLIVVARLEQGDFAAADAEGAAYARIADRLGVPHYRWLPQIWLGRQACLRGDLEAAEAAATQAAAIGAAADSVNARWMVTALRWHIYRLAGTLGDHRDELAASFADIMDVPSSFGAQAESALSAGDRSDARRFVQAALSYGLDAMAQDSEWLAGIYALAGSAIGLDDRAAAEAAYATLSPYAGVFVVEGLAAGVPGVTDLMLGRLAAMLGDPTAARRHLDAAVQAHRRTGSPVLIAEAEAERDRLAGGPPTAPASAPAEDGAFRRAGRLWQVAYKGQSAVVPDSKGMGDLAVLLATPGREVHVLDLVDMTGLARATATPADDAIDPAARAAYTRRLRELEEDLAEAEGRADLGRAERLRAERDFIAAELGAALGLGGRVRTAADPVERARKAVGMRVATALRAVEAVHEPLARHLRLAVRTGRFCTYAPESPVRWHT